MRLLVLLLTTGIAFADVPNNLRQQMQAMYLLRLSSLTPPSQAVENYNICFYNKIDLSRRIVVLLEQSKIHNKSIKVKKINSLGWEECNTIYFTRMTSEDIEALKNTPYGLLTVSSVPGFAKNGGTFELVNLAASTKYILNHTVAKEKGINLTTGIIHAAESIVQQ